MDDLANELEASSFIQTAIQPVANSFTDEDELDEESRSGENNKYKEDTVALLKSLPALRLKVPQPLIPKVPLGVKDSVRRTPDGSGIPKLVSWASEMSMYDGCSPKSPGLPKNLPTPNSNPNMKIMYKDAYLPALASPEQSALLPGTHANETTDNDVVQPPRNPSEETQEGPSVKNGRPVMCAIEFIENRFELEASSSPSSHGLEGVIPTPTSLPLSSESKVKEKLTIKTIPYEKESQGVISNSTTSTDWSSPKINSQNLATNEHRPLPKNKLTKGKPKISSRFGKPIAQNSDNSPRKPRSSAKRNSGKGQSGSSRSKVRSKKFSGSKSSGTKPIRPPVFDFQNLIINYLPPDLDSASLRHLFEQFGTITNCKVVLDHETGLSKGYGFVKFQTKDQAEKAIGELNQFQIGSKTLKVSYARRTMKPRGGDSGSGKIQHTNLYIANLDKNIDSRDLQQHFSSCGYIVQCRVLKDEQGATRRIGFVRYDSHESALKAIKRYDGKKMDGTKSVIQVRFANSPRAPPNQSQSQPGILPDDESSTLSPPGLPAGPSPRSINGVQGAISLNGMLPNISGQGLIEVGGHYVPVSPTNMQCPHDVYTAGTVLSTHSHFQQGFQQTGLHAMATFSPGYVASQVTYAPLRQQGNSAPGVIDKQQRTSNNNCGSNSITSNKDNAACYVSGIDIQTEESTLISTFDPNGDNKVKSVRIIRRRAGPYAFVNFFNSEDAADAAETFDQTKLGSQTITVRLKAQQ